jgi:hypothetical protein
MARLTAKRLPQGETAAARVVHVDVDTNPLAWRVPGQNGLPSFEMNIAELAEGNLDDNIPAKPVLAGQLAPHLRAWSFGKTKDTAKAHRHALRSFWRFLAAQEGQGLSAVNDVAAVTSTLGILFKNYLIYDQRLGPTHARKQLQGVRFLVEGARASLGLAQAPLLWPTVQEPRRAVHEDVPKEDLRTLYNAAKAIHRAFSQGAATEPSRESTCAAFLLVLLHTGWNVETLLELDVSSDAAWCQDRLASDAGDTVAIFANKGRTGREQIAFSLAKPEFHPYQVIRAQIQRTEPLREHLRQKVAALETEPQSPEVHDRVLCLKRQIASPWLYVHGRRKVDSDDRISGLRGNVVGIDDWFRKFVQPLGVRPKLALSDLRDGFALFLYDNSLYNAMLVKRALGHGNLSATKHYLRQRRMLAQRFADYADWSDGLFDEIQRFRAVDPTILYVRCRFGDVTDEQRKRLADHRMRTRMGMGCLDPEHPPDSVAPQHSGGMCTVQRCTLCHHGVLFADSFAPLAQRLAELQVIRRRTPLDRWDGSSFQAEWIAIEGTVERVFPARLEEFDRLVFSHRDRLLRGENYLFDQIGIGQIALTAEA